MKQAIIKAKPSDVESIQGATNIMPLVGFGVEVAGELLYLAMIDDTFTGQPLATEDKPVDVNALLPYADPIYEHDTDGNIISQRSATAQDITAIHSFAGRSWTI